MNSGGTPDALLEELGGCGRFQIRLCILVHALKTAIAWSITTMRIFAKTPPWWCADDVIDRTIMSQSNGTSLLTYSCVNLNGSKCQRFEFKDDMDTIVSEFGLVCDLSFVPTTVMSIQMAGMLIGNPLSGQIADLIGRKKPMFIGLGILILSNVASTFSPNWIIFAISRFFIGLGSAFFLTVQYNLMCEFSLSSWRPWITGFPSWAIQASVYIFIAWLLPNWQYMQVATCILVTTCLVSWRFIPESFRWHMAHGRITHARRVLKKVAYFNKHSLAKFEELDLSLNENTETVDQTKYTFLDLFRTIRMAKVTIMFTSLWFGLGFITYGIGFGVQTLSGNLFVNSFLFTINSIPAKLLASFLLNKIGRTWTSALCFLISAVGGLVVGIVQHIETDYRIALTNGFALAVDTSISAAWVSVQTMTIELYPTVIRNIGFGSLSTIGRIGAVVGPQMLFLENFVPGVLFFASAGISFVCLISLAFLPETKGGNLPDKIRDTGVTQRQIVI